MNLRRRVSIFAAVLVLALGLLATFLSPQVPVAEAGQWCGHSCSDGIIVTPPPETE